MPKMKKFRIGLIVCALILIITHLIRLVFGHLNSHERTGSYIGMVAMVLLIVAVKLGNKNEVKQKSTDSPD